MFSVILSLCFSSDRALTVSPLFFFPIFSCEFFFGTLTMRSQGVDYGIIYFIITILKVPYSCFSSPFTDCRSHDIWLSRWEINLWRDVWSFVYLNLTQNLRNDFEMSDCTCRITRGQHLLRVFVLFCRNWRPPASGAASSCRLWRQNLPSHLRGKDHSAECFWTNVVSTEVNVAQIKL